MFATRDELIRRLAELEAAMPNLISTYPDPADFFPAFAGCADEITDQAGPADDAWVSEQINRMLTAAGYPDAITP